MGKFKFVSEWLSKMDAWSTFEAVVAVVTLTAITVSGVIGLTMM